MVETIGSSESGKNEYATMMITVEEEAAKAASIKYWVKGLNDNVSVICPCFLFDVCKNVYKSCFHFVIM